MPECEGSVLRGSEANLAADEGPVEEGVELVLLAINVFIFAIVIQVILSWVNPGTYNPVNALLHSLTQPLLGPIQRLMPPVSGIDLSPLFALIGLQVLKMLIQPLAG